MPNNLRMMDQTKAFPRKVNADQYKPLIDAAMNAAIGEDNLPRVVIQDFDTYKLAIKAANAVRNYSHEKNLNLRVSCPENGKSILVYKSNTPRRTRTKKAVVVPDPVESETTETAGDSH